MKHSNLIFMDSLLRPLYFICKWLKALVPKKNVEVDSFYVIKFFGLGSLTRIAYCIENIDLDKEDVTLITFKKNQTMMDYLGIKAVYIRSNNPFYFIGDLFTTIFHVWRQKKVQILDMERSSNFSGMFRVIAAIRKPSSGFFFEKDNTTIGNQEFISLNNKPAINAIAELFGKKVSESIKTKVNISDSEDVIINVNAGAYLPQRMNPLAQFSELVTGLHHYFPNWTFLLTGADNECERVNAFEALLTEKGVNNAQIRNLAGKQNLLEMLGKIQASTLVITNDSGPLHFAQLLGTRTVGIWGPTSAEMVGYPNSETMLNLTPTENCSPCFLNPRSKVAKACGGTLTCFHNRNINSMAAEIKVFVESSSKNGIIDPE